MRLRRGNRRHVSTTELLDFLEGRLASASRRRVEEHLGGPCAKCRERLRQTGRLIAAMQEDRTPAVPEALRRIALAAFVPSPTPVARPAGAWAAAKLIFDSLSQPLPAAMRRAVGSAQRLEYEIGPHRLELELEPDLPFGQIIRGHLDLPDPELHRLEIRIGVEILRTWADSTGSFDFEAVPLEEFELLIEGPHGRFRIQAGTREP